MDNTYTSPSISIFILFKKTLKKNPEKIFRKHRMKKIERIHFKKNTNIVFNLDRKKNHTHPFKGLN